MRDEPAQHTSVRAIAASQDAMVPVNPSLKFMGYTIRETAGAAASIRIGNAATAAGVAAGDDLATIALAANGFDRLWLGPNGVAAEKGLSVVRLAGTFDLTLFWKVG